jgi:hypothetical protein
MIKYFNGYRIDDAPPIIGEKKKRQFWSPEEDSKLMGGVRSGLRWAQISSGIDGRSNVNCKDRWRILEKRRKSNNEEMVTINHENFNSFVNEEVSSVIEENVHFIDLVGYDEDIQSKAVSNYDNEDYYQIIDLVDDDQYLHLENGSVYYDDDDDISESNTFVEDNDYIHLMDEDIYALNGCTGNCKVSKGISCSSRDICTCRLKSNKTFDDNIEITDLSTAW